MFWRRCNIMILVFQFALCFDFNNEFGTFFVDAVGSDRASHLLDNVFANWQAEASALAVSVSTILQLPKINKELFQILLFDAYTSIDHGNLQY